ncbi:hypothetical protein Q7C36_017013 [Tachysurus vachellii]|uniref:Uncharacterized protein n=1 Tax=Tachysurus vachellii TaxID=175792 RepID=A0AA88M274_TACVA|nr:hypothetical protein Q7C36_017013 [Tachysurus vachellii]
MVPFKEVLSEVRKVLQEENLLPSLLAQLVEAQIFSAQYYQTFISENLCDVDVDEMARRLALPVWEKWDASKVILSSVLMENEPENHVRQFRRLNVKVKPNQAKLRTTELSTSALQAQRHHFSSDLRIKPSN